MSRQYTMRFRWTTRLKSSNRTPLKLLVRWFSLNYAEVLERFRQELLRRDVKGCTIGDIHSQIIDLIKGDRVLRWLQPASSGLSKMEILIGWLEENYAAYLRSNQKSALINGLRDKIATAGFPRCAARELREQISSLETPPWSPFLKLYSHRLDAIYGVRVKREPDAATNEPRAARKTHQDINETRETQRNNKVTPRDSRDDSPIKIEPCFPDGSANAPLVVYGDGDENSREFSNEPTLEEIPDVRRWWMHDSSTARTRERCLKTNLTCPSPCPRFKYSRKKCWVRTP